MNHITILEHLIRLPTVNDPAKGIRPKRDCPEFLEDTLSQMGVQTRILESQGFFSVLGVLGTGRPVTLFLAHFDVVPIGPGWKSDPFELSIKNQAGYGRGTADDKGNVTALLLTAESLVKQPLQGTLVFAMTGDEEIGGTNGAYKIRVKLEKEELFPDYLITADGVGMQIVTRRRNTCGITITVPRQTKEVQGSFENHRFTTEYQGRESRHSAYFLPGVDQHALLAASSFLLQNPHFRVSRITGSFIKSNVVPDWIEIEGINPDNLAKIEKRNCDENLTRFLQALLPLSRVQFETFQSDYGITLCPNLIDLKNSHWEVYFDGRAMTTNGGAVKKAISAVLSEKLRGIKYSSKVRMGKAFMNTPFTTRLVKTAQKIASEQGLNPNPIELGGASDTRHFTDRHLEAIDFGPIGFGVHGANEHVVLDSIPQTAEFYVKLASILHNPKRS